MIAQMRIVAIFPPCKRIVVFHVFFLMKCPIFYCCLLYKVVLLTNNLQKQKFQKMGSCSKQKEHSTLPFFIIQEQNTQITFTNPLPSQYLILQIKQIQQGKLCYYPSKNTFKMSTKQSQLYMYFQNKAHHYQNIQTAKSKVEDRLEESMNQSIDYISRQKYNRDFPLNRRYQVDVENDHMNQRLSSIQTTSRKEVSVNGNYSRYNSFERKFRQRNKAHDEEERERQIKNAKIQAKIKSMKPQVGSNKFWLADYKNQTQMRREVRSSKGSLLLEKKSFMAEAYLDFIHQISRGQAENNPKDMNSSRSSKGQEKAIAIEKLFVLPSLSTRKPAKLKNSQVTISPVEQNVGNKEPKNEEK